MARRWGEMLRPAIPWAVAGVLPAAIQVVVLLTTGTRPRRLVVDVAELSDDIGMFTGMFSMLGVVLWFAAATGCWLAVSVLRDTHPLRSPLLALGAVSAILGVDDALLLHENMPGPDWLPDLAWVLPVGVWVLVLAVRHRHRFRPEWGFAVAAAVAFGTSITVDVVFESILESNASGVLFFEENAKLAGVVCWAGLCLHAARRAVASPLGDQGARVSSQTDDGGRAAGS